MAQTRVNIDELNRMARVLGHASNVASTPLCLSKANGARSAGCAKQFARARRANRLRPQAAYCAAPPLRDFSSNELTYSDDWRS